jgi:hypothetical protein
MLTIKKNNKGSLALVALVRIVLLIYKDLKILTLNVFYKD